MSRQVLSALVYLERHSKTFLFFFFFSACYAVGKPFLSSHCRNTNTPPPPPTPLGVWVGFFSYSKTCYFYLWPHLWAARCSHALHPSMNRWARPSLAPTPYSRRIEKSGGGGGPPLNK